MKSTEFLPEASIFDERTLKNTKWQSPKETMEWLKENGFEQIGAGLYARVFAKQNHNRVVKISTMQDKCWIKFAQYAMSHVGNKHLPNIPWIKRYQGEYNNHPAEFFITIIERLTPLAVQDISKITDPGVIFGLWSWANLDDNSLDELEDIMSYIPALDPNQFTNNDLVAKYRKHPFVKAMMAINNLPGCMNDLHQGNLMVRKDGTLVIIDPLAVPG